MRLGTCEVPAGTMATAHADPLTGQLASLLVTEGELILFDYVHAALLEGASPDSVFGGYANRVHPLLVPALRIARDIAKHWKTTLGESEIGHRKGAVLEKIVAELLSRRVAADEIRGECRVEWMDGTESYLFDILSTPSSGRWESFECKWQGIDKKAQAQGLAEASKRSTAEGGGLLVALASLKPASSVEHNLRTFKLCGLVNYASVETILALAGGAAKGRCNAPSSP
jgi:hypothetical protein